MKRPFYAHPERKTGLAHPPPVRQSGRWQKYNQLVWGRFEAKNRGLVTARIIPRSGRLSIPCGRLASNRRPHGGLDKIGQGGIKKGHKQTTRTAVDVLPLLEAEARERIKESSRTEWGGNISTPLEQQGKSRDHAAAMFNTNGQNKTAVPLIRYTAVCHNGCK